MGKSGARCLEAPDQSEQEMLRPCTGHSPGGVAVACGMELVSPTSSAFLGRPLDKGWAVQCPERGMNEISIIALKCSQDETFPTMNSKSASFWNSICKGRGGESGVVVVVLAEAEKSDVKIKQG